MILHVLGSRIKVPNSIALRCLSNSLIRFSASWMHLQQLCLSASLNKSFYIQKNHWKIFYCARKILDQKKHDRLESRAHFKVSSIADLLKRSANVNSTVSAGYVQPTCARSSRWRKSKQQSSLACNQLQQSGESLPEAKHLRWTQADIIE